MPKRYETTQENAEIAPPIWLGF